MINIVFNDDESKTYNTDLYTIQMCDMGYIIRELKSHGNIGEAVLYVPLRSVKYISVD